jgi:hypothetical protein
MYKTVYELNEPKNFSSDNRQAFRDLLVKQAKVTNPTIEKVNRCSLLCICMVDNEIVSIGAIKPKTKSDFSSNKANLSNLQNDFEFELGYCFTLPDHTGQGHSSKIVDILINRIGYVNLMASTELRADNSMVGILVRRGFKQYGKPWKSTVHNGTLGLFLKFTR